MGYLEGPNYTHVSSQPNPHPILGSDWNANSSSSSSEKGGRRRRSRKLRKRSRKTMRRRK